MNDGSGEKKRGISVRLLTALRQGGDFLSLYIIWIFACIGIGI